MPLPSRRERWSVEVMTLALSLVFDADHSYGSALNVMRTVKELEAAGVSALTMDLASWSASLPSESASRDSKG
jgi:2-methylisocitrate lyase-like PEP mutase family enzyme